MALRKSVPCSLPSTNQRAALKLRFPVVGVFPPQADCRPGRAQPGIRLQLRHGASRHLVLGRPSILHGC